MSSSSVSSSSVGSAAAALGLGSFYAMPELAPRLIPRPMSTPGHASHHGLGAAGPATDDAARSSGPSSGPSSAAGCTAAPLAAARSSHSEEYGGGGLGQSTIIRAALAARPPGGGGGGSGGESGGGRFVSEAELFASQEQLVRCLTQTKVAPSNQKNQRLAPLLQPCHTCHTPKVTLSLSARWSTFFFFFFFFTRKVVPHPSKRVAHASFRTGRAGHSVLITFSMKTSKCCRKPLVDAPQVLHDENARLLEALEDRAAAASEGAAALARVEAFKQQYSALFAKVCVGGVCRQTHAHALKEGTKLDLAPPCVWLRQLWTYAADIRACLGRILNQCSFVPLLCL